MTGQILYEDVWGEAIDRDGYMEIRWYDSTAAMSGDQFNEWLSVFAGYVEERKPSGVLVDATQFSMPMERMNTEWRDENIVPRYDAAGLQKFAFHMPAGMPLVGNEPAPEGPAQFSTGYFGKRAEAVEWLSS